MSNLEKLKKKFLPKEGALDSRVNSTEAAGILQECGALNERAAAALERALGLM